MKFAQPLERGILVQRYKRFFADVALDTGEQVTAHCPNPGAMLGMNAPGMPVWLSRSDSPTRKLAHTLELVETPGGLVSANTMLPNRIAAEALAQGWIPELAGYDSVRPEVKYGLGSRVDFLLEAADRPSCWVEVKGVTLCRGHALAEWPDCVSTRAVKHLDELEAMAAAGDRAVVLFIVQRSDCDAFAVCGDLDPTFAAAMDRARTRGVEVLIYACSVSPDAITLGRPLPWRLT